MTENVTDKVYFSPVVKARIHQDQIYLCLLPWLSDLPLGDCEEDQVKTEVRVLTVGKLGCQRMPLKSIGTMEGEKS